MTDRQDARPTTDVEQIDDLYRSFRDAWASGGTPRLEVYLSNAGPSEREVLLAELLWIELKHRGRTGVRPMQEEYVTRFPDLSNIVDTVFEERQARGKPPEKIGRYLIRREEGQGGMGVILRALDPNLDRDVAIKVIHEKYHDNAIAQQRFLSEARIMGQLQHPGVPPIYEIGICPDRGLYISMKLIHGKTLADLLSERSDLHKDLPRFIQICQTMSYVHSQGVVHRDLKPVNIMVGKFGELQILDWGLAGPAHSEDSVPSSVLTHDESDTFTKSDDAVAARTHPKNSTAENPMRQVKNGFTQSGEILGTYSYMSPEQARGERIDERSDVFALGSILCELLTGQPAYVGQEFKDVSTKAKAGELEDAYSRLANCGEPTELVELARQCLATDPRSRPKDARIVAETVTKYLVSDRDKLEEERTAHKVAIAIRHVTIGGLMVLATLATGFGFYERWTRETIADKQKETAEALVAEKSATTLAETMTTLARRQLFLTRMQLAHNGLDLNLATTLEILNNYRTGSKHSEDFRGFQYHYMDRVCHSYLTAFDVIAPFARAVSFSPNGRHVATGDGMTVRLFDISLGKEHLTLSGHSNSVSCTTFSPDGSQLASASFDKTIKLWDLGTGRELRTLKGHAGAVMSVAFSPDGLRIASSSNDNTVRIWDLSTGRSLRTITGHSAQVFAVAFSPDGSLLASGGMDRAVVLWDTKSGKEKVRIVGHRNWVTALAFAPNSRTIASGDWGGQVRLSDVVNGNNKTILNAHSHYITSLAFSRGAELLASSSDEGKAKLWNANSGNHVRTIIGDGEIMGLAFSPNGRFIVTGGVAGLKTWDVESGQGPLRLMGTQHYNNRGIEFSSDGKVIASCIDDSVISVWDVETGLERWPIVGHMGDITDLAFKPNSRVLASSSRDGTVRVWDVDAAREMRVLTGHSGWVLGVAFSPNGRYLASAGTDRTIKVWNANTWKSMRTLTGHSDSVNCVAFSPNSRNLAAAGRDRTILVWNLESGHQSLTLEGHDDTVTSIAFGPTGRYLASASQDKTVIIWNVKTGDEVHRLTGHSAGVNDIAFDPTGLSVVSGGSDGHVKLWDLDTGLELVSLQGHSDIVHSVAFAPDGDRIASASYDQTIRLWDGRPVTKEVRKENEAQSLLRFLNRNHVNRNEIMQGAKNSAGISAQGRKRMLLLVDSYWQRLGQNRDEYQRAAWHNVARPSLRKERYLQAFRWSEFGSTDMPDPASLVLSGASQYRLGNYESALETLRRASDQGPLNSAGLAFLAMTQYRLGLHDEARRSLKSLKTSLDTVLLARQWNTIVSEVETLLAE